MSNARVLLDQRFTEEKANYPSGLSLGEQFELFSANIVLRDYNWSYSELEDGRIGGSKDGGVDTFYLLVNGILISDEDDLMNLSTGIEIKLILIQSKHEDAVREAVIDRLLTHIDWILSLDPDENELKLHFSTDMLSKLSLFRSAMRKYGTKQYELSIDIHYCCRGPKPTQEAKSLANKLVKKCKANFSDARASFAFAGAEVLHKMAAQTPFQKRSLKPVPSGMISASKECFVLLVSLKDYIDFLTEDGSLQQSLFEFNVRDYEGGRIAVNAEMAETVQDHQSDEDFWWFNNGVTIITSKAENRSGVVTVERPMIVNGLQTSTTIFENREALQKSDASERSILVRVVQVEDAEIQEKVIKATNSQTSLKPLALKATDQLQRDIEDFLVHNGIYYERRKNFYKNRGKPSKSIIDITRLGQAVMSLRLKLPHQARGRAGTYLKSKKNYKKVFVEGIDFTEYVVAAQMDRKIDEFLAKNRASYDAIHRNNLRFHTLMVCGWELAGKKSVKPAKLKPQKLTDKLIKSVFEWVRDEFDGDEPSDARSKDEQFTEQLKSNWKKLQSG